MKVLLRALVLALAAFFAPLAANAQTATFDEIFKATADLGYSPEKNSIRTTSFAVRLPSKVGTFYADVFVKEDRILLLAYVTRIKQDTATLNATLQMNRQEMVFAYLQLDNSGLLQVALPVSRRGLDEGVLRDAFNELVSSVEATAPLWEPHGGKIAEPIFQIMPAPKREEIKPAN